MAPRGPFRCYRVEKSAEGDISAAPGTATLDDLPEGDVIVRVHYTSLNYKDALALGGHPGVVRTFPHVPGLDFSGTIVEDASGRFAAGDEVLVTGYGMGSDRWGGYSEFARVQSDWVIPLPAGLSLRESMIYGTAGFTAAQCVDTFLAREIAPSAGPVLVTGASGGVGSMAVGILARLGYEVAAVTGKTTAHEFLRQRGAAEILSREDVIDTSDRPLLKGRWAAAVDTVGGTMLASVIRAMQPWGCVCACGLVGGTDLPLTVYPFILRGVQLVGIDSSAAGRAIRDRVWPRLADDWRPEDLATYVQQEIALEEIDHWRGEILAGLVQGRVLIRIIEESLS